MPPKKKGPVQEAPAPAKDAKGKVIIPSRDERLAFVMEKFNKDKKGTAQVKRASDYRLPWMTKRLPTGLLQLDTELGGGFPAGGLSEIKGQANLGKDYLIWQVVRELQHILGKKTRVLFAMTEMRVDKTQGRKAGAKVAMNEDDIDALDRALVANNRPALTKDQIKDYRTEIGEIYEMHGMSAEDLYDGILSAVEANAYHLVVINSWGSILSAAEAEVDSLAQKTYGGSSAVTTKFCQHLAGLLSMDDPKFDYTRDTCLIGVNQIREDMKNPGEFRSPGGRALEHTKFVSLQLEPAGQIGFEAPMMTAQGSKKRWQQLGKEVGWKIAKGKAGIHEGGRGSYLYMFDSNMADFYIDTFVAGVRHNVIEATGAWFGFYDPEKPDEYMLRANGRDAFVKALSDDAMAKAAAGDPDSVMNLIRAEVYRKRDISISYHDWVNEK